MWQTDPNYSSQNYRDIQAHAKIIYNNEKTKAHVKIVTKQRLNFNLVFKFGINQQWTSEDNQTFSESDVLNHEGLVVSVGVDEKEYIVLDPVYFMPILLYYLD